MDTLRPSNLILDYIKNNCFNKYLKLYIHLGFPGGSVVKNPPAKGDNGFNPWVRKIPRIRKRQPTPVFLPWKSYGQRSLAGYSTQGCKRVRCNLETKQQIHLKIGFTALIIWKDLDQPQYLPTGSDLNNSTAIQ